MFFSLEAFPKYTSRGEGGPIIRVDELSCLTMLLFGLSDGYVVTMAMSQFVESVEDPQDMDLASNIAMLFLNTGLLSGSLLGLAIGYV